MYILTLSRTLGSLGDEIAERLARTLGAPLINKETTFRQWLPEVTDEHGVRMLRKSYAWYHHTHDESETYKDYISRLLRDEVSRGPKIFMGMGTQVIFRDHPNTLHLRINAPVETRLARLMDRWHLDREQALANLAESDTRRRKFIRKVHGADWEDETLYDLKINTRDIDVDAACAVIRALVERAEETGGYNANQLAFFQGDLERFDFRHDVEREFASILDSYGIAWSYEPTTFPLTFDEEGNVTQAITPDFYLQDEQTYVELTMMNPRYMAEKRRKVERMRELYPDSRVILMDKRGLHALIKRFRLKSRTEDPS